MSRQKTLKALTKRVKTSPKGKLKRSKCGRSHLMSSKDSKRRRHLRRKSGVCGRIGAKMSRLAK